MDGARLGSDICGDLDVRIGLPDDGIVRIESARLFADPDGLPCRRLIGCVFRATEIDSVVIAPRTAEDVTPAIELRFDATQYSPRQVLEQLAALLDAPNGNPVVEAPSTATAHDRHGTIR